jgi:hypothetical protein
MNEYLIIAGILIVAIGLFLGGRYFIKKYPKISNDVIEQMDNSIVASVVVSELLVKFGCKSKKLDIIKNAIVDSLEYIKIMNIDNVDTKIEEAFIYINDLLLNFGIKLSEDEQKIIKSIVTITLKTLK